MKKFTKYSVVVLSILTISLVNELAIKAVNSYYKSATYFSVVIGMVVTVVVFIPLLGFLKKIVQSASNQYIRSAKKVAPSQGFGVLVGVLVGILVLFALYAHFRHGIDIASDFQAGWNKL